PVRTERRGNSGLVLDAFKKAGVATPTEIAAIAGVTSAQTRSALAQMVGAGEIIRGGYRQYLHRDNKTADVSVYPRRKGQCAAILATLKGADGVMPLAKIIAATGLPGKRVTTGLHRMAKTGEVIKVGYGRYLHPDNQLTSEPQEQTT